MYFLELNDLYLEEFAIKMEDIVVSVASGKISKDELKVILQNLIKNFSN